MYPHSESIAAACSASWLWIRAARPPPIMSARGHSASSRRDLIRTSCSPKKNQAKQDKVAIDFAVSLTAGALFAFTGLTAMENIKIDPTTPQPGRTLIVKFIVAAPPRCLQLQPSCYSSLLRRSLGHPHEVTRRPLDISKPIYRRIPFVENRVSRFPSQQAPLR